MGTPMKTYRITYAGGIQQDWVADSSDAAGTLSKQHGAGNLTILRIEETGKLDAMPMKPRNAILYLRNPRIRSYSCPYATRLSHTRQGGLTHD